MCGTVCRFCVTISFDFVFVSETSYASYVPGVAKVSDDALSSALCGVPIVSSGANGVGKIMSPSSAMWSHNNILGMTWAVGYDSCCVFL